MNCAIIWFHIVNCKFILRNITGVPFSDPHSYPGMVIMNGICKLCCNLKAAIKIGNIILENNFICQITVKA